MAKHAFKQGEDYCGNRRGQGMRKISEVDGFIDSLGGERIFELGSIWKDKRQ